MPEITYRKAISQALREILQSDPRAFMMGEDIGGYQGAYAVTRGFLKEFGPERIKDTPIAESVIVGAGIGAAMAGSRPIIEIMTINFSLLAMDQIVNCAAKLHYMSGGQVTVPLVIRTVSGGGTQLAASHSQSLEGWFAHVPGLKVVAPSTPYDAKGLLKAAYQDPNPVMYVEHSLLYGMKGYIPDEEYSIPLGVADVKREGSDVTIISYSRMVQVALKAAVRLEEEGIDAEVVDLRSLRPMDTETIINSVKKTSRAVVVEEGWKAMGIGAEVSARIMENALEYLDAPVQRVASADIPMPYSRPLELATLPNEDRIIEAVHRLF
ncbi:MAG: alpha-ketoacid dehydrogenase subunit beta [Chloroflexi bacterium]|nr:alpha-ketoacid dehydrogenase subunit beta [Chloroflexota bacterium]